MTWRPGRRTAGVWLLVVGAMSIATPSCGRSNGVAQGRKPTLTVFAAASLRTVFPEIAERFSRQVRAGDEVLFSFAGTDALVTQVEQGAPADVFAGASKKYGDQLSSEGLILPASAFATNALVVIVPASNPARIETVGDVARKGVKLVIGAATVPVGSYARTVLKNLDGSLGPDFSERVLANVVSDEDSVDGVLTKVRLGEADAGFVYVTDARAAGSDVKIVPLPGSAQAVATYPIAVVKSSSNRPLAVAFVSFVLSAEGQAVLRSAGFGPPPSG